MPFSSTSTCARGLGNRTLRPPPGLSLITEGMSRVTMVASRPWASTLRSTARPSRSPTPEAASARSSTTASRSSAPWGRTTAISAPLGRRAVHGHGQRDQRPSAAAATRSPSAGKRRCTGCFADGAPPVRHRSEAGSPLGAPARGPRRLARSQKRWRFDLLAHVGPLALVCCSALLQMRTWLGSRSCAMSSRELRQITLISRDLVTGSEGNVHGPAPRPAARRGKGRPARRGHTAVVGRRTPRARAE